MTNGYEDFGKYLLSQLKIEHEPEDWYRFIRTYTKRIDKQRKPGLLWINWIVCTHFNVDPISVRNMETRKHTLIKPRHVAQYLAAILFGYTQYEIGEFYKIKNRSLISNNNENVESLLSTDKYYRMDIDIITNKLLGYDKTEIQRTDTNGSTKDISRPRIETRNDLSIYRDGEIESSD